MATGDGRITETLALAEECLRDVSLAVATVGHDPMEIQLPPLLNSQSGTRSLLSPEALRVFAAMYLESELEQTGVIAVTEALAAARDRLSLNSVTAARLLDEMFVRRNEFPDRQQRELLFARVFGTGAGATVERGNAINSDFEQLLATLCLALVRYSTETNWNLPANPVREVAVRRAAIALLVNLSSRQFGNTLIMGPQVAALLQRSVAILGDASVTAFFQTRNMWDTLRALLGDRPPDLGRLITRGQSGMRLLRWLAGRISDLMDERQVRSMLAKGEPAFLWASSWLEATGLLPTVAGRTI